LAVLKGFNNRIDWAKDSNIPRALSAAVKNYIVLMYKSIPLGSTY